MKGGVAPSSNDTDREKARSIRVVSVALLPTAGTGWCRDRSVSSNVRKQLSNEQAELRGDPSLVVQLRDCVPRYARTAIATRRWIKQNICVIRELRRYQNGDYLLIRCTAPIPLFLIGLWVMRPAWLIREIKSAESHAERVQSQKSKENPGITENC
ncbi:hypothetical protein TSAR_002578 [Trichomalopsis sarcophagae]|uniref:Uncharacterized protein n=1 Tax=Trichomalopsis sarcophagae TaxID=543379 RepID=A0A232EFU8_9HYME|nr:hypothetical protein TSAR_002578 [Trichomalopsis sarcophagae]